MTKTFKINIQTKKKNRLAKLSLYKSKRPVNQSSAKSPAKETCLKDSSSKILDTENKYNNSGPSRSPEWREEKPTLNPQVVENLWPIDSLLLSDSSQSTDLEPFESTDEDEKENSLSPPNLSIKTSSRKRKYYFYFTLYTVV